MAAIDYSVPSDSENASLGGSRIREVSLHVYNAWQAYKARHEDGTTVNDPGTSRGAHKIPFVVPSFQEVGDFWFKSGQVIVYESGPTAKAYGDVPSGTYQLFQQTSAPYLWTKQTTENNAALRVVSGSVGSGGSSSFSTVFGTGTATDDHTLTTSEIPAHEHKLLVDASAGAWTFPGADDGVAKDRRDTGSWSYYLSKVTGDPTIGKSSQTGGDGKHNHGLNFDLKYVDVIIAKKD